MIEIKNLTKFYKRGKTLFPAVHNVSFVLNQGEILGLVGESGSGKSTLGRMLLRFIPPTSGHIFLNGQEITQMTQKDLSSKMQMIFQNPASALNPRMSVEKILQEPLHIHRKKGCIDEFLEQVGLSQKFKKRFPHELSGGEKQRISIARALVLQPKFIVCDEPTSSLDASMQKQILNLLLHLAKTYQLTYLFITHNLAILQKFATKIGIMHAGELVELETTEQIYTNPSHPFTKLLFCSAFTKAIEQTQTQRPDKGDFFWPRSF